MSQYGFHMDNIVKHCFEASHKLLINRLINKKWLYCCTRGTSEPLQCVWCLPSVLGQGQGLGQSAPGGTWKLWEQATGTVEEQFSDFPTLPKERLALNCILCRTQVFHAFPHPLLPKSTFQKQVLQIIH